MATKWRHDVNTASTVMLCMQQVNFSALAYKDSHVNVNARTQSISPDFVYAECAEVDYLLLCMPYALTVSISTLVWLRLISTGMLHENLQWDDALYSECNGAVFLYDLSYYIEVLCMKFFFIFLCVHQRRN